VKVDGKSRKKQHQLWLGCDVEDSFKKQKRQAYWSHQIRNKFNVDYLSNLKIDGGFVVLQMIRQKKQIRKVPVQTDVVMTQCLINKYKSPLFIFGEQKGV
jgi:hypothetical protein